MDVTMNLLYTYCPDANCWEMIVASLEELSSGVTCRFCGCFWRTADFAKCAYFSLSSDRVAVHALKSRLARVPHRLSDEYARIVMFSPFICKYMSPLFTFNKIQWDEAQLGIVCPLEFRPPLQRQCLNMEIFADRTFLISHPYLKTPGFGEDTKASFYLQSVIERISYFNNWSPDRQCLIAAYGGSYDEHNTVFFALSRALVGREIFWHALRTNARRHLEQHDEFYRKLFQLKLDDKAYMGLIDGCTIGTSFKKEYFDIYMCALSNILYRPIIILDKIVEKGKFPLHTRAATYVPIFRTAEECISAEYRTNSPVILAYAEDTYTTIVPLLSTQHYRLPKDLIPNSKYAVSSLDVLIGAPAAYLDVGNDRHMDMSVTTAMCHIMAKKCVRDETMSAYIVSDYCENVLRLPYYKLSAVKKLKHDLLLPAALPPLYRCLICWRLSRMPDIDESLLTSGSILYEKIRCLLVDIPDGLQVAIVPIDECGIRQDDVAMRFEYSLIDDEWKPKHIVYKTCLHCGYSAYTLRLVDLNDSVFFRNFDHTRTPGFYSRCHRRMQHYLDGRMVDNPSQIFDLYFEHNGKIAQQRFFWSETEPCSVDVTIAQFTSNFVETHYKEERNNIEFYEEVKKKIVPQVEALCKVSNPCLTDSFWSPVDIQTFTWVPPERINREKLTFEMLFENDNFLVSPMGPTSFVARQKFNMDNMVTPMPIRLIVSDGRTVIVRSPPSKIGPLAILNFLLEKLSFLGADYNANEVLYKSCGSSVPVMANKKSEYNDADQYIIVRESNIEYLTEKLIDKAANEDLQNVVQLINKLSSAIALRQLNLAFSGTTKLWEYLEKRPQLFVHDGLFDRILWNSDTIMFFPSHFEFTGILPDINFYFSTGQRCLYLCLPNIGHLQIDAKLRRKIRQALEKRFDTRIKKFVEELSNNLLSIKLPFFKSLDVKHIIHHPKNCGAVLIM